MFQEGLYQVFVRETPPSPPPAQAPADNEELYDVRIHRWFGTVVNTRVLVAGAVQIISALACLLFTVTHACVTYNCSVTMITPVWSSLCYLAAGCLAIGVQKRANQLKVITLMGLNIFSLLFGFSALLANSVSSTEPVSLPTREQRAGSNVAKGSSITFSVQCFLASVYILFLSWKGLHRYSPTYIKAYSRLPQNQDETNGPLLEQEDINL